MCGCYQFHGDISRRCFPKLCFAESKALDQVRWHYLEFNRSRSINAIDYGLLSGSSIDQSSMLARAIKYASGNKEIDSVIEEAISLLNLSG